MPKRNYLALCFFFFDSNTVDSDEVYFEVEFMDFPSLDEEDGYQTEAMMAIIEEIKRVQEHVLNFMLGY